MAQKYKKIDQEEFRKESFSRKPYFSTLNLSDIRYRCRIDLKMVDKIRQNFSSKYRRKNLSLSCPSCKHHNNNINDKNTTHTTNKFPDSQNHLLHQCPAFSHLHEELDIKTNEVLIQFFKGFFLLSSANNAKLLFGFLKCRNPQVTLNKN